MADLAMTVPVEQELRLKMSYEEFFRERQDKRYAGNRMRGCC